MVFCNLWHYIYILHNSPMCAGIPAQQYKSKTVPRGYIRILRISKTRHELLTSFMNNFREFLLLCSKNICTRCNIIILFLLLANDFLICLKKFPFYLKGLKFTFLVWIWNVIKMHTSLLELDENKKFLFTPFHNLTFL